MNDEVLESEDVGDIINESDNDEYECVDDGHEYNFVNDLSEDTQSDQVDLIDLEADELNDELNDTHIENVDEVEHIMFQNLDHDNLDSEMVENWVLVQYKRK